MELNFQIPAPHLCCNPKKKKKTKGKGKFVGVRQRSSGRWVAEIKDTIQKIRMWLGTYDTAEEAARAYDQAAYLLRGADTRTNFASSHPPAAAGSPLASRIRGLLSLENQSKCGSAPNPPAATSAARSVPEVEDCGSEKGVPLVADEEEELELEPPHSQLLVVDNSWMFECLEPVSSVGADMSVFDRMKVERQFSASLYAMNGVQEYLKMVQEEPSAEGSWHPPLCHLCCT